MEKPTQQPTDLHCTDAQAPVDYKLTESCWPLVAVPSMHHQQTTQMFKLSDREICCKWCLFAFLCTIARSFYYWGKLYIYILFTSYHNRISRKNCNTLGGEEYYLSISAFHHSLYLKSKNMKRIPIWTLASDSNQLSGLWFTTCMLTWHSFYTRSVLNTNFQSQQFTQF